MVQVVRNLTSFLMMLTKVSWAANAAQAALAVLTQRWWLIPAALAAAGVMFAMAERSRQFGGPIEETGWYYLHRGEYVVPRTTVNRYGPFVLNVTERPFDAEEYFRRWSREVTAKARRAGY